MIKLDNSMYKFTLVDTAAFRFIPFTLNVIYERSEQSIKYRLLSQRFNFTQNIFIYSDLEYNT